MELNQEQNTFEQVTPEQDVPKVAFCYKCGAKLLEGAAFCSACGAKQPVASAPTQAPEQPKPTYTQELVAPVTSTLQKASTKTPIVSIILMAIAFLAALIFPVQYKYFDFYTFLKLTAYSAMLVSFVLHKKNMYFIAGIGWAVMMLLQSWYLIRDIEFYLRWFEIWDLVNFLYPTCCTILALAFFLSRTKANVPLRIIGAVMGLLLEAFYLIGFAVRVFDTSSSYAVRTFVVTVLEASLFVSVLTVKPNTK